MKMKMKNHGEFISVIPSDPEIDEGYWAVLADGKGGEFILDDCFDTPEEAKQAGEDYRRDYYSSDLTWSAEQRMQAGMAFGVDGYNDTDTNPAGYTSWPRG